MHFLPRTVDQLLFFGRQQNYLVVKRGPDKCHFLKYGFHFVNETTTIHSAKLSEIDVPFKMFLNIVFVKNKLIHLGFAVVWVDLETHKEVEFPLNLVFLVRINVYSNHAFANPFKFVQKMIILL